jgi:hypothetical protein
MTLQHIFLPYLCTYRHHSSILVSKTHPTFSQSGLGKQKQNYQFHYQVVGITYNMIGEHKALDIYVCVQERP